FFLPRMRRTLQNARPALLVNFLHPADVSQKGLFFSARIGYNGSTRIEQLFDYFHFLCAAKGDAAMPERTYLAIDLKSFYASVECVERGLDPLTTNLVVADESRTEKTICLAVSPSLKAYGIPGRAR